MRSAMGIHLLSIAPVLAAACCLAAAADKAVWQSVSVPGDWKAAIGSHLGFGWYRCVVNVPKGFEGKALTLHLGQIDDCDEAFVNGTKVGATGSMPPKALGAWNVQRAYQVPAKAVRPGKPNLIAVRVYNAGGGAGIVSGPLSLACEAGQLELAGTWQIAKGDDAARARWPVDPDSQEAEKLAKAFKASATRSIPASGAQASGHSSHSQTRLSWLR